MPAVSANLAHSRKLLELTSARPAPKAPILQQKGRQPRVHAWRARLIQKLPRGALLHRIAFAVRGSQRMAPESVSSALPARIRQQVEMRLALPVVQVCTLQSAPPQHAARAKSTSIRSSGASTVFPASNFPSQTATIRDVSVTVDSQATPWTQVALCVLRASTSKTWEVRVVRRVRLIISHPLNQRWRQHAIKHQKWCLSWQWAAIFMYLT
jgi:hypothetical protein